MKFAIPKTFVEVNLTITIAVKTDPPAQDDAKKLPEPPKPLDPKSDTFLDELRMGSDGCPNVD